MLSTITGLRQTSLEMDPTSLVLLTNSIYTCTTTLGKTLTNVTLKI